MILSLSFVVAISAVLRPVAAIHCNKGAVDPDDCYAVMADLNYQADQTLDRLSKQVHEEIDSCSIKIFNRRQVKVTKQQLDDTVKTILGQCQAHRGDSTVNGAPDVLVEIVAPSDGPYSPNFEIGLPVCGLNTGAPDINPQDCQTAYLRIPRDDGDNFLSIQGKASSNTKSTYRTCTVLMKTTDRSIIQATKAEVEPSFQKMVRNCGTKSGVVNIQGGTDGDNGHVIVKMRSSAPCAGKSHVGQRCR